MKPFAPQTGILLAIQAAMLAVLLEQPAALGALTTVAAGYWLRGGGFRHALWVLALAGLATWGMVLSQGLFYAGVPRTVWLTVIAPETLPAIDGVQIYREGLWHGWVQSLRVDVVLLMGAGLLARYDADRLAGGLRALGLPSPLAFLFMLALRFTPLLASEARLAWHAGRIQTSAAGRRALGERAGAAVLAGPRMLVPLLVSGVRKGDEIATALVSRGWNPHTALNAPGAPGRERTLCLLGALLVLTVAVAQVLTWLAGFGLVDHPSLDWLYVFVRRTL